MATHSLYISFILMLIRPIYARYQMEGKEMNLSGRHFHFPDQAVINNNNNNKTIPMMKKNLLPKCRVKLMRFGGIISDRYTTYLIHSFEIQFLFVIQALFFAAGRTLSSITVFAQIPITLVRFFPLDWD